MRCLACNKALNDFEATRKSATTGDYVDLCNHCFHDVEQDIQAVVHEEFRDIDDEDAEIELDDLQGDVYGIQE